MAKRCLVLSLCVELHRGVGEDRSLLRRHGCAAGKRKTKKKDPLHLAFLFLEVHAEAGGVGLPVFVRALREDGEIRGLDADEDAAPESEQETSSGTGEVEILALEDERVWVR